MRVASITPLLRTKNAGRRRAPDYAVGVTLRYAFPDDAAALRRLAALDSAEVPGGPLLVAEVGGEIWAAVTLAGPAAAIADPFRPTSELVLMLHERARRLTAGQAARATATGERRLGLLTG